MRSATRLLVLACALGFPAASLPVPPRGDSVAPAAPGRITVEPAPPLLIDLQAAPVERAGKGAWRARLALTLDAGPEIRNLGLRLILPDGVVASADDLPRGRPAGLAPGETRRHTATLEIARSGVLPLRVEASYELPDGRTLHARQGVALRVDSPAPAGRRHAGAYEFMAVPIEELPAR